MNQIEAITVNKKQKRNKRINGKQKEYIKIGKPEITMSNFNNTSLMPFHQDNFGLQFSGQMFSQIRNIPPTSIAKPYY
ncbi:UNVERIFIED_CONTAM: hypothetical protein NCL1_11196 [Trichonephila clavipes]